MKTFFAILLALGTVVFADSFQDWEALEMDIRDCTIPRDSSVARFPAVYDSLLSECRYYAFLSKGPWFFPVQGYQRRDAGRAGFRVNFRHHAGFSFGFDFFDAKNNSGHPAFDIFIDDKNQDSRDDRTGLPVNVIAPVDLLVLSSHNDWKPGMDRRGGNYLWALDPGKRMLYYFAHLDSATVPGGTFCRAGTPLATVGRTGSKASEPRSPSHLHLMVLSVQGGSIMPYDFYNLLGKTR
jgi:hypothetical protein